MVNTRELRRRIKSTKNTAQITKAMQMVSAVKMRRAQDQALAGRPYSENLNSALSRLLPRVDKSSHPLLFGNESKNSGVILLSTDKGLCGSLNTNLFRILLALQTGFANVKFYTVGKKGRSFVVRSGKDLIADFENPDQVIFRKAVQLTNMIKDSFKAGEVGQVYLVYPQFISTIKQEPKMVKLLPIDLGSVIATPDLIRGKQSHEGDRRVASAPRDDVKEFLYEPSIDALLDSLLLHEVQIKIYQALMETKASEHSSRMVAMKNATDNAKELVEDLTLNYNQVRQDSITREILEISSAAAAME